MFRKDAALTTQFPSQLGMEIPQLPANVTSRLLMLAIPTRAGPIAAMLLRLQHALWRRRPHIVERLSNFLPIGGVCAAVQIVLLLLFVQGGIPVFIATALAVELSVLLNFVGNRFITWGDRFSHLTLRQNVALFLPLFVTFNLTTPTVWMKIVGIASLTEFLGVPVLICWLAAEALGVIANYLGSDKLAFGAMAHVTRHVARPQLHPTQSDNAPQPELQSV